ncbi:ATP-binding region ATPase domain protein [Pseudobacteroides cellulosolvens ATCC 35603 = DSM 2933]|uniref:histidine kinase n=2 Tax=Pseudobacteroides cellulosolvens TaxID=35825 RepID=A0A0L6JSJ8_9FIRM|nr:ATP-binding region ATPase domain protein [Pseudobacteroides cellulosolvens ATCC 35603 = DSM 2933]
MLAENKVLSMKLKQIHETMIDNERLYFMGRILGSITHNMKTPLMCIGTSIQSLKELINEYSNSIGDSLVTNDDHHDIAKDMEVAADNIYQYLVYLKDLALTLKDQTVSRSISQYNSFTIDDLLKRLNIILNDQLKVYRCTMNSQHNIDGNTIIKGKLISLIQVICNLVINSAEAYENGGTIDFKIDEQNGKVQFIITDCAGGIPKDIKEKLFKELVTNKGKDGTGIGVYSSYQIIKKDFMGDIEVVSEEGIGTTFIISIPNS